MRYTLGGGRLGAVSMGGCFRALVGMTLGVGLAPLPARFLARIGARRMFAWTQRRWARSMTAVLGLQIDWQGLDLIDPDDAYVVTPLHEGLVDVLALLQLPLSLRFVVRDEFVDWPLLGGYLRDTGQIMVQPEAGVSTYRKMIRQAQQGIRRNESLVVFPQGSILGIETDFLPGAFALARTLQRPVLPVALTGSHRVWEHPYSPRLRRGQRMSVSVLPPITAAEVRSQGTDELRQQVQRRLKTMALNGKMMPPRRFLPSRDGYWDGYSYEIDPAFSDLAADVAGHRAALAGRQSHVRRVGS